MPVIRTAAAAIIASALLAGCGTAREAGHINAATPTVSTPTHTQRNGQTIQPVRNENALYVAAYCYALFDLQLDATDPFSAQWRVLDSYTKSAAVYVVASGLDKSRDSYVLYGLKQVAVDLFRNDQVTFDAHIDVCANLIDRARGRSASGKEAR